MKKLRDKIAMYKHRGHLECQVSRASAKVRWYKNKTEIKAGEKYEIRSEDVYRKLTINDVVEADEDTYTCDAVDDKTSCKLLVEGNTMGGDGSFLYLASNTSFVRHSCSMTVGSSVLEVEQASDFQSVRLVFLCFCIYQER